MTPGGECSGLRIGARRAASASAALALAAALALSFAGCSAETVMQAQKAVGESEAAPALAGQIEPFGGIVFDESADGGSGMPKAGAGNETSRVPRIHLTIASPDVELTRFGETKKGYPVECVKSGGASLGLPISSASVAAGGTAESCVQSKGNEVISQELTYRLPGTNQLFWVYAKATPLLGAQDELQCAIIDPGTWKAVKKSDYRCDLRWMQDDHLNPMPRVRVTKKPTTVITDGAEAQRLLEKYCSKGEPECSYRATRQEIVETPGSQWNVLDVYNNCGPDRHESAKHQFIEEKSLGMQATFSVEKTWTFNIKIVKLAVSTKYSHAWSAENKVTISVENSVPWGYANIFYLQPTYLEIDGDFTIKTDDGSYVIRDANFRLPVNPDWRDEDGRRYSSAEKHARGVKIDCPAKPTQGSSGTKMLDGSAAPTADTLAP
ncbi:hypothetical protein ACFPZL_06530 [Leucobacter soli]